MDTRTAPARMRIAALREHMAAQRIDGVLLLSSDPHLSEYLPGYWQSREYYSGFTGSMGTLAVTMHEAALFADSRYWTQAEAELTGSGIGLVKIANGLATDYIEWLGRNLFDTQTLALDGTVVSLGLAQAIRKHMAERDIVVRTDLDVPGLAWAERPGLPAQTVYAHDAKFADETRAQKLDALRTAMHRAGATHHVISTLDDVAWLTNLRGSDVAYNPVFLAHALVRHDDAYLFIAPGKISEDLAAEIAQDGWKLASYEQFLPALGLLERSDRVMLDPKRCTLAVRQALPDGVVVVEATNPTTLSKSRKTNAQARHIREAMAQDGAAMCAFYAWFEKAQAAGERITELTVDERLSAERAKRAGFVGLSFATIAGFNANGALPHYRATSDSHAAIEGSGLLLIDSGGQYLGGTTDITRVWPIGPADQITPQHKRDYTLVLKGMMQLSRTRFPRGTPSPMLDAIAREPMWQHGLDYGHGTGHGVGYFMNVHEGPQTLSRSMPGPDTAMQPGMITSIEPGLYREGHYGIRIENLVLNREIQGISEQFGQFLEFETLTLCPIDTTLIDRSLMRPDEVDWLNGYHATVRERVLPLTEGEARVWLLSRTEAI